MTRVRVLDVGSMRDSRRSVILLEDLEQRLRLTFSTDAGEAQRLAKELGRGRCRCNPIYDFIQSLLDACGATIGRVVLEDLPGKGLEALVDVTLDGIAVPITLSCFPPDALALALRVQAPIYATPRVLAHAEPWQRCRVAATAADVQRWLGRLRPDDF
jgi:bifunctional DNase/RNase